MPYRVGEKKVFGLGERGSGFKARSLDGYQDFQKIKEKCLRDKVQFQDDEFSANDSSIGKVEGGPYKWKRPQQISKKKPEFIVGGADRFDARQGDLPNCWLIAAIADLTLNQDNFKMVVPEDNTFGTEYTGAFHFRFWQFGKWIDVVIDDRLPCGEDGQLAFLSSASGNEFWSPLLEKAYAKLNGSYGILDGGLTFEALEDFTGGFTEVIYMNRLKSLNLINGPEEFYDMLKSSFERETFMGTNVKENPDVVEAALENGLICGHAYSITNIHTVTCNNDEGDGESVRLLRLRNPWGTDEEWKGDWCDGCPNWKTICPSERKKLEVTTKDDGEFWMSYEDFLENFERIEVCHLNPHSEMELLHVPVVGQVVKKWVSHAKHGNWTSGVTAGGSFKHKETFGNNPQFILDIGEPGEENNTLIVCLLKKEKKREPDATDVENVSLNVFAVDENSPRPLDSDFFADEENKPLPQLKPIAGLREITIRFSVPSGTYCIIPSSVKPNQEGDFLLRVFTEGRSSLELYDEEVDIVEKEVEVKDDSLKEKLMLKNAAKFFKGVAGNDEEVSWWGLQTVLDKCFENELKSGAKGFSEDACRSLVALLDADRSGKLGFYEFTNLWTQVMAWKKIFKKFDANQSHTLGSLKTNEMRSALKAGGYGVNKDILEDIVLRYGDKNGEVSLDKFIVAALKVKMMIELYKRHEMQGKNYAAFTLTEWLDETLYS